MKSKFTENNQSMQNKQKKQNNFLKIAVLVQSITKMDSAFQNGMI